MSPDPAPLALKPVPVAVMPEMVMLEFPVLVNVVDSDALWPAGTAPKLRLAGLALNDCVAAAPLPDKAIANWEGEPLVVSVTEPLALLPVVGAKTTSNVALDPAAIVVAVESPVTLNPGPVTET